MGLPPDSEIIPKKIHFFLWLLFLLLDHSKTTMGKFAIQWSNDTANDYKQPMSSRRFMLRRTMRTPEAYQGLTCQDLFLDQVYIMFRPTPFIAQAEFVAPDSSSFDWHSETDNLLVRIHPGFEYPLHIVSGTTNPDHHQTSNNPDQALIYSAALSVKESGAKNLEEHYWCRTYRPIRDAPVASNLIDASEIQIDLLFPVLQDLLTSSNATRSVPDYRILRVLCEFSYTDS